MFTASTADSSRPKPRPEITLKAFTLPEALWLHENGVEDVLVAYPTTDRGALARLGGLDTDDRPAVMVDCLDHLELIGSAVPRPARPIRVGPGSRATVSAATAQCPPMRPRPIRRGA